jgi:hypothetical protein
MNQEYVPGPAAEMSVTSILDLGTITKAIAILVHAPCLFEIQPERFYVQLRECVQLIRFRDAIVIRILPQAQG